MGYFNRGERFTAVTTGLLVALVPALALGGDALVESVERAAPQPPPDVAINGELPVEEQLSPEFLDEVRNGEDLSERAEPADQVPAGPLGIPGTVLAAYQRADRTLAGTTPGCGLHWSVLAGIGRIESHHARSGRVDADGRTLAPILGPRLSGGPGIAAIRDTDGATLDGDAVWDRAVGPMQFIPSTWRSQADDGNADGIRDPHNVFDAALAAGRYLCSGGGDLRDRTQLAAAVFRYNHSQAYVRNVLAWADAYARGVMPTANDATIPPSAELVAFARPLPPEAPPPPGVPQAAAPPPAGPALPPAPAPGRPPAPPPPGTTTPPPPPPPSSEPPSSSQPPSSEPPPTSEPPTSEPPPPATSAPETTSPAS
ncbi:Transglycosylase SLT domain-containing protein [Saccharopolyspora antimicrobica]|uniref:Transglycosylase SLT domain-containing protein n=1 Tax=Saccharopolyspora antimicrobica TaxID=455193 RepID=A0A1I4SAH6_9PSEU|nr:lytic murein transglycosylase [Saccharopolyspora antimicrobica]RKT87656.1 transglycosylase protein with SLT domain [Saccharopolyspora antimicrobica]SFM61284.1 Transglycosylase SLT domain-containing protein [Saccharopolyspora antimicrobica]